MKIDISVTPDDSKEDYFFVKLKTYKQSIEGRFERNELNHLVQIIDNAIGVYIKPTEEDGN